MPQLIRLLVADDHIMVREGLVALLEEEPDLIIVGQAGTGAEAIAQFRQHQPDVTLLDINMPDLSGLEATAQITAKFPLANILILTMHEEVAFFFEALLAGAAGYILKGARGEELIHAIRVVHEGGVYLPPKLAGALVQYYLNHHPSPHLHDPLTPREREVLTLIAQGLTNRAIANQLMLSLNTVKTHRAHIYQKLNLDNKADLVTYAMRRGFLGMDR